MKGEIFIEDVLLGIHYFLPENSSYSWSTDDNAVLFFHAQKQRGRALLKDIPFRIRATPESYVIYQAYANMRHTGMLSFSLSSFKPVYSINERCRKAFEDIKERFTEQEIEEMKTIAEDYHKQFSLEQTVLVRTN